MKEDSLIELIKRFELRRKRIPVPIGDDCTYLEEKGGRYLVISVDSATENVHFKIKWLPLYYVGFRTMAAALSDIAVKGALPLVSLVDLHVPPYINENQVEEIYRGMSKLARRFSFSIAGGNISRDTRLSISITVIGEVNKLPPLRSGAKSGDYVYVTGDLGRSLLFVRLMEDRVSNVPNSVKKKFFAPIPRFRIVTELLNRYRITSIMDISDGLGIDASRIARASGKKIFIYEDLIPVSNILSKYVKSPRVFALHSGEEYEVLFTSPDYIRMPNVHRVGIVDNTGYGAFLKRSDGKIEDISSFGFDHLK